MWFFLSIKLYYESRDRATLSGYSVVFFFGAYCNSPALCSRVRFIPVRNAPDGYAPEMDEDDGAMSAWYMFAQMGFYPVVVGTDSYAAFSPLFDKITIRTGGHTIKIRTRGKRSYDDGQAPRRLLVDGKEVTGFMLSHDVFKNGSEIVFEY